jgi:hypothetical protein
MRPRTAVSVYVAVLAGAVLANFLLWRYRLHLYELNTDYEREPLQTTQLTLFRGTRVFMVAGLVWLAWWKFSKKNLR